MAEQITVIGVFADRQKARDVLKALLDAGFTTDKIGFAGRHEGIKIGDEEKGEPRAKAVVRGILGGILGAADALLVPFIGPADASSIFTTVLPVTEEALDHLPYPGSHRATAGAIRPDTPMTLPASSEAQTTPEPAAESSAERSRSQERIERQSEILSDPTPEESARTGAVAGGVVGGIVGGAVALLIPGIGPAVAGGILASTFGGVGMGSIAGSFLDTFINMGVPEEKARYYEQEFKAGNIIVTVTTDAAHQEQAQALLKNYGAHDVASH